MKKILLRLNNMRFYKKMILIYFACIIIPLFIVSLFYFSSTINKVQRQRIEDAKYSLRIIKQSIQNYFNLSVNITDKAYFDENIYQLLDKRYEIPIEKIGIQQKIIDTTNYLPLSKTVDSMMIYTENNTIANGTALQIIDENIKKSAWYRKFGAYEAALSIYTYIDDDIEVSGGQRRLSLVRKMNYYKKYKNYNVIKVDLSMSNIINNFNGQPIDGTLYLLDENSNIICSSDTASQSTWNKQDVLLTEVVKGKDMLFVEEKLDMPNKWKIVACIDKNHANKMFVPEINSFVMLIFFNILFASVVIWFISKSFVKRLRLLTECMENMKRQQFKTIDNVDPGNDEVGVLIRGVNGAISIIKQLIEDVYQSKIREAAVELEKNRAEINALHSQINPHFLFNVLEAMRMKSVMKKESETAKIIKYLSRMFRRVISWGDDLILLEEELSFIREYLEIQMYRFGEELTVTMDVDEEAMKCKIPKMILQVFVENACVHGIEGITGAKAIALKANCINGRLICQVWDNGKGVDEEVVKEILENRTAKLSKRSIGIRNAMKRIQLYYGDDYIVRIYNDQSGKTVAFLDIPVSTNNQKTEEETSSHAKSIDC